MCGERGISSSSLHLFKDMRYFSLSSGWLGPQLSKGVVNFFHLCNIFQIVVTQYFIWRSISFLFKENPANPNFMQSHTSTVYIFIFYCQVKSYDYLIVFKLKENVLSFRLYLVNWRICFTWLQVPSVENIDLKARIGMGSMDATPRHQPKTNAHVG